MYKMIRSRRMHIRDLYENGHVGSPGSLDANGVRKHCLPSTYVTISRLPNLAALNRLAALLGSLGSGNRPESPHVGQFRRAPTSGLPPPRSTSADTIPGRLASPRSACIESRHRPDTRAGLGSRLSEVR